MGAISIEPVQHSMVVRIKSADFPDDSFAVTIPESIGDGSKSIWVQPMVSRIEWRTNPDGSLQYELDVPDEARYAVHVTANDDTVDIEITLTNNSNRVWETSHAFTCFNGAVAYSFADHELIRTYGGHTGKLIRLIEHPRKPSERPPIQLYGVEGAPSANQTPFVAGFKATSPIVLEGFLAIVSKNRQGVMAVASRNPLYLFNNLEYSCIHACPNFGRPVPGNSAPAFTRLYVMRGDLESFYKRFRTDFAA